MSSYLVKMSIKSLIHVSFVSLLVVLEAKRLFSLVWSEYTISGNLLNTALKFPTGERIPRQTTAVVATNFSILLPARLLNIHKSKISFEFQGLIIQKKKELRVKKQREIKEKNANFMLQIHWPTFKRSNQNVGGLKWN